MSPTAINTSGTMPAPFNLPVTNAPPFYLPPFTAYQYNPGTAPCGAGWSAIPSGNLNAGYCEPTKAGAITEGAMIYAAMAGAVLLIAPGWFKAVSVIPAVLSLSEFLAAGPGF